MITRVMIESAITEAGAALIGVVELGEEPDFPRFANWLAEERHAGMAYLDRYTEIRRDPRKLLAGAQSAVVFGLPYFQGQPPAGMPEVAQYAKLPDYHKTLRRKGEAALAGLETALERPITGRVVVDSAPLLERALASRAERGFIGKNTMYIHPEWGSFLLLGELLLAEPCVPDHSSQVDPHRRSEEGGCGTCRRCQVHCPTGALDQDYQLDANKCLSYWTIENRGPIPLAYWPWLKTYYYGCDICQLVCPYNRGIPISIQPSERRSIPDDLMKVACMTQEDYERYFGGTPMTRAKRAGLRRNALIAMVVTNHPRAAAAIDHCLQADDDMLQRTARDARQYLLG